MDYSNTAGRLDVQDDQINRLSDAWSAANAAKEVRDDTWLAFRRQVVDLVSARDSVRAAQLIAAPDGGIVAQHIDDLQEVLVSKFIGAVYCGAGAGDVADWSTANAIYDFVMTELRWALENDPHDFDARRHVEKWELIYRVARCASGMMEADRLNAEADADESAILAVSGGTQEDVDAMMDAVH